KSVSNNISQIIGCAKSVMGEPIIIRTAIVPIRNGNLRDTGIQINDGDLDLDYKQNRIGQKCQTVIVWLRRCLRFFPGILPGITHGNWYQQQCHNRCYLVAAVDNSQNRKKTERNIPMQYTGDFMEIAGNNAK